MARAFYAVLFDFVRYLVTLITQKAWCDRYEEAFRRQLQELGEDPEQIAPWLSLEKLISMYSHSLSQNVNMPINVIQVS